MNVAKLKKSYGTCVNVSLDSVPTPEKISEGGERSLSGGKGMNKD